MKHVFLVGDSIRMGYSPFVRELLAGEATVDYPGENCRFSANTLCFLSTWAEQMAYAAPENIDLVHWNNGLWDVCHFAGDPLPLVPPEAYRENLRRIAGRIRRVFPRAQIAYSLTTGVDESRAKYQHGVAMRTNEEIAAYNAIGREVMAEEGIPVNPLDDFAASLPDTLHVDWVHYTSEGYRLLAENVAAFIRNRLNL